MRESSGSALEGTAAMQNLRCTRMRILARGDQGERGCKEKPPTPSTPCPNLLLGSAGGCGTQGPPSWKGLSMKGQPWPRVGLQTATGDALG